LEGELTTGEQVGPDGAIIRQVVGLDSPYLPVAMDLLRELFPDYEHYVQDLRVCALQSSPAHPATLDHLWVVECEGRPVGLRVFHYIHTRNVGHGAFIGLLKPYQDRGIGTWLVEETLAQLCSDAEASGRPEPLGYVAEVNPIVEPGDEATRRQLDKRLAFYRKCGALLLDVDYMEPPMIQSVDYITPDDLDGVEPAPMQLLLYPTRPRARLSEAELVRVVEALYVDYYRLEPGSWYVRRALDSVRTRRERTG
jgi:GNAT superfamily N-acetyltransferase